MPYLKYSTLHYKRKDSKGILSIKLKIGKIIHTSGLAHNKFITLENPYLFSLKNISSFGLSCSVSPSDKRNFSKNK